MYKNLFLKFYTAKITGNCVNSKCLVPKRVIPLQIYNKVPERMQICYTSPYFTNTVTTIISQNFKISKGNSNWNIYKNYK